MLILTKTVHLVWTVFFYFYNSTRSAIENVKTTFNK